MNLPVIDNQSTASAYEARALGRKDAFKGLDACEDTVEVLSRHGVLMSQTAFDQYELGYLRQLEAM